MRFFLKPISLLFFASFLSACSTAFPSQNTQALLDQQNVWTKEAVFVVNGADASLSVLDPEGTKVISKITLPSGSFPHHAYVSPDRNTLAISLPGMDFSGGHGNGGHEGEHGAMTMPGRIALLDLISGQIKNIKNTPAMHHNAIFSPDGKEIWAAAMESNGRVFVYDANSFALLKEIPVGQKPAEVTFSADGQKVFVANGGSDSVSVIDPFKKEVISTLAVGKNPVGAWVGSDQRMYVDNEESQSISVINSRSLQIEQTLALGFMPGMAALHSNHQELWVSDAQNGKVVVFTRSQENQPFIRNRELITGAGAHAIAFSKDGKKAFVSNQEASNVSVIDVKLFRKERDLKVGNKPNGLALR